MQLLKIKRKNYQSAILNLFYYENGLKLCTFLVEFFFHFQMTSLIISRAYNVLFLQMDFSGFHRCDGVSMDISQMSSTNNVGASNGLTVIFIFKLVSLFLSPIRIVEIHPMENVYFTYIFTDLYKFQFFRSIEKKNCPT